MVTRAVVGISADITIHLHGDQKPILTAIQHLKDTLMASNSDLLAALNTVNDNVTAIGTEVDKIGTETQTLVQQVADLTAAIGNGNTTPEVDAALAAVQATVTSVAGRVQTVDNLVPDAPVTP
jgi:phospholipase/lecithinase/hemolysin